MRLTAIYLYLGANILLIPLRCTFENNESALDWYNQVSKAIEPPRHLEQLFAFCHCAWAKEKGGNETALKVACQKKYTFDKNMFENEASSVDSC